MGAWGSGLFSDDLACDVRDAYRDALEGGASDAEAEATVVAEFAGDLDPREVVVFWLALAVSESKLGRLTEGTLSEALRLLDHDGDLNDWREDSPAEAKRRASVMARVRVQIEGPQPSPVRIRRRPKAKSTLHVGDVLAYRGRSANVHMVRVDALIDLGCGYTLQPALRLLEYSSPGVPTPAELGPIPDRRRRPPWKKVEVRIIDDGSDARSAAGFEVVGTIDRPVSSGPPETRPAMDWKRLADYFDTRDQLTSAG